MEKVRRCLEEGVAVDFSKYNPHVIGFVILQYLEMLREPLITPDINRELMTGELGMGCIYVALLLFVTII